MGWALGLVHSVGTGEMPAVGWVHYVGREGKQVAVVRNVGATPPGTFSGRLPLKATHSDPESHLHFALLDLFVLVDHPSSAPGDPQLDLDPVEVVQCTALVFAVLPLARIQRSDQGER